MSKKIDNPREIALKILYDIEVNNAYSNVSLNKFLNSSSLKTIDRAFTTHLIYGVITNKKRLDWIISKFSNTPIKKMTPGIINILRLGIYQILYMDKVPPFAAVNEMVSLGKKYGHKKIAGFINGVLRNIVRAPKKQLEPSVDNEINFLSIFYSHPIWMVEMWVKMYGLDFTSKLLKKNNEIPPITIRTNTLKTTRKELMLLLKKEGLLPREGQWCPESIVFDNLSNIGENKYFQEGLFHIQDESSMLVGHILNPLKDQLILDICVAPGGKITHIAELMDNSGSIIGRDIYDHKIGLVKKNIKRLGISNIQLELFDALQLDRNMIDKADRVLIDAPCSGLGIIRKKPDLKWNKSIDDLESIILLQKKMIENAGNYVKRGGYLIYSTCTINQDENLKVVKYFLDNNPQFRLAPIKPISEKMKIHEKDLKQGYIQLFPHIDDIDGFFISKMQRII